MTSEYHSRLGRLLDAVSYAVAVTAAVVACGGALSFPVGLDWLGVKWVLFLVGWLTFGYATFTLRPKPPWSDDDPAAAETGRPVGNRTETRFQAAVQRLPPARFRQVPVDDRLSDGARLFLASLAMLGTSLAMEVVFGI